MLLPVVLWGPHPPSHTISCLFLSRDDKVLISGSTEGQLLVCDVFSSGIVPRCFLVGHSTEIVGIDQIIDGLNNTNIVSASFNGEIYKWDITDGSFVTSTSIQGPLIKLITLPSSQNILVCGQYGAMTVLNPSSLEVNHVLVPSDPTHWMLCCTIFQPPKSKDEEVVSMTVNGQVKTWNLQYGTQERQILESETKILSCPKPVTLTYNPKSLYNCLIVCEDNWRIYRAGDFVLLCSDCSQKDMPWQNGAFCSIDKVILWKENGMLFIYKLPSRAIHPVDHSDTNWTADPAVCLFSIETGMQLSCILNYRRSKRTTHHILIRGDTCGRVSLWKTDNDIVLAGLGNVLTSCLADTWPKNTPSIVQQLFRDCNTSYNITASVAMEPLCYIACGVASGDIIIGTTHFLILSALFRPDDSGAIYKILKGHTCKVTILLFPHSQQPDAYTKNILYSGGADFSVKIWDWEKESLLQTFTVHSGPVIKLILPSANATGRLRGSVISVCEDNTIAITKSNENSVLFFGCSHHTTVLDIRWRLSSQEDILIVHCIDDTVYVWGLSTGHLDRVESGAVALSIISASDMSVGYQQLFKISHPGVVFPKQATGLSIVPFRFNINDGVSHIVLFDTELLLHLLSQIQGCHVSEDNNSSTLPKNSPINFDMLRKKVVARAESKNADRRSSIMKETETAKLLEDRCVTLNVLPEVNDAPDVAGLSIKNQDKSGELLSRSQTIKQTCSLLLSCLHAWGVDLNIDRTCLKHLGLFAPLEPISYGTVSSNSTFMLLLPHWENRIEQHTPDTVHSPFGRWCISSTLTTQHLLSVSALANKQMSTDLTISFNNHIKHLSLNKDTTSDREEFLRQSINESEKKAGWSHVTALHCIVLPEHVPDGYCAPLLTHLAVKWQDQCMEVREASQALFLRELRRIGFAGRQQLVNQWYPYVVRKRERSPPEQVDRIISVELPKIPEYFYKSVNIPTQSYSSISLDDEEAPTDAYSMAVIILGVIVAEFPDEVEREKAKVTSPDRKEALRSSFLLTQDMLKMVAAHLFSQLTQPPSQLPLHSPIRRASVDLIGRGFGIWCDFMNLTAVLITLLELQSDPMVPIEIKKAIAQSGTIPSSGSKARMAAAATVRAAYQASILIANNKAQQTVNAISKEIMTFKCDVEAGLSIQSLSMFPSSYHAVLDRGRYPVYLLVQNVIEKTKVRELAAIIVKITEIMLFCIDTEQFKTRTLSELVPALTKNPLIDYCASTQQVAVGSNEGLVHIFDIRNSKCLPLHAHNGPTSVVSFSSNGRILVSFSEREGKVSIWQSSSGLLSLPSSWSISSGPLKLLRVVDTLPPLKQGTKSPMFKWETSKLISLFLSDGTKKSFAV